MYIYKLLLVLTFMVLLKKKIFAQNEKPNGKFDSSYNIFMFLWLPPVKKIKLCSFAFLQIINRILYCNTTWNGKI